MLLLDQDGWTIGLVNAAQVDSGPVTTYTYDPSGNPTVSGTANDWPFQYQGMEKEFTDPAPYYYSGSGQFYSPHIWPARELVDPLREHRQRRRVHGDNHAFNA